MPDTNKRTHLSCPSLLLLREALTAAESETPSRPPRVDPDEHLALQLIERMKTEFAKPLPSNSWNDNPLLNSFRLQEVIGTNV